MRFFPPGDHPDTGMTLQSPALQADSLQRGVSFPYAAKWISYPYSYSPHFWISFPLRSPQSTKSSLCYTLHSIIYVVCVCVYVYTYNVSPNLPIHPTSPLLPLIFICLLSVYFSISAVQITVSTQILFQIPHVCVNTCYLFFSFWLTSLCMTFFRK